MPILTFVNLKGGVAKTTSAVAVAEALATAGKHWQHWDIKKGVSHLRGCETPVDEAFRIIVRVWLIPFSLVRN